MTDPRYTAIHHSYIDESNRVLAVADAAGLPMVGIVDEEAGGVIAYVSEPFAEEIFAALNRSKEHTP